MRLQELRDWLGEIQGQDSDRLWFSRTHARELVADIDAQLRAIPRADGWNYRDAVRTGWEGAIRKMREHLTSVQSPCGETAAMGRLLSELSKANDVTAPADSELGIELSKIRDRLNAIETSGSPRVFALLDERLERLEKATYTEFQERLAALEQHPERLGSSEKHIDRRVEQLEGINIKETFKTLQRQLERIEYLERQERLTLQVFEEQKSQLLAVEAFQKQACIELDSLQKWRERVMRS